MGGADIFFELHGGMIPDREQATTSEWDPAHLTVLGSLEARCDHFRSMPKRNSYRRMGPRHGSRASQLNEMVQGRPGAGLRMATPGARRRIGRMVSV